MGNRYKTEKLVLIALLVALSVVFGIVDRAISSGITPHPALRLGLANIIVLTSLYYLSFYDTLLLVVLKTVFGLILTNPLTFIISSFGASLSFIVMFLLVKLGKDKVSVVGVSIAGALSHTIGQVIGLSVTNFYSDTIVFALLWLIPLSAITGVFVGIIVTTLRKYLDKGLVFKTIFNHKQDSPVISLIEDEKQV